MILPVREPYDWERVLDWLGTRAIPGLEVVEDGVYRREGEAEVARVDGGIAFTGPADPAVVARVFDTAHDPRALGGEPLFARAPGIRVPGAWSGWELAVRAVLGQQVSVAGARRTAEKLVAELGDGRRFPAPEIVADGPLPGMPQSRERALRALAARGRRRPAARPAARRPGDARGAARAAGLRPLDRRVHRHARAARSRRLAGERPLARPRGRCRRSGALAAVARLRGDGAVADGVIHHRCAYQPPASRSR